MSDRAIVYPIVIDPLSEEDGGGFAAYAPDLYGCMSDGETEEEAVANLRGAIVEWLTEAEELGREIPEPHSFSKKMEEEVDTLVRLVKAQGKLAKMNEANKKKCRELEAEVACLKQRLQALEPIGALHRALNYCFVEGDEFAVHHMTTSVPAHVAAGAIAAYRRN